MGGLSVELILMLGYSLFLAIIAAFLEWAAQHVHKRSRGVTTAGFTYHPDRDIWRCPQDQHLFPIFSDSIKGVVIYRAPADACNSCISREACTDSADGRQIERKEWNALEHGMQRFHRAISITLLVLANLIVVVELFRARGLYSRIILAAAVTFFSVILGRLYASVSKCGQTRGSHDAAA